MQGDGIKSTVELLVRPTEHDAGGREHRNGAAIGIAHHHFARRVHFRIIKTRQLARGRHEQWHAREVFPILDGGRIQNAFVRPAALSAVSNVVHNECPVLNLSVDG